MDKGLLAHYDVWRMGITATGGYTDTSAQTVPCSALMGIGTDFQEDAVYISPGIGLEIALNHADQLAGADNHTVKLRRDGMGFVLPVTWGDTGFGAGTSTAIELVNLRLYVEMNIMNPTQPIFRLLFDELQWFINGTLIMPGDPKLTSPYPGAGPSNYSYSSPFLTPSSVPLLGLAPNMTAGATPPVPLESTWTQSIPGVADNVACNASVTGGWGFKEKGAAAFTYLPVEMGTYAPMPTGGTACEIPDGVLTNISVLNTGSATIGGYASLVRSWHPATSTVECTECPPGSTYNGVPTVYALDHSQGEYHYRGGSIRLIPNLPRSVKRMNSDYRALILRGGIPYADHTATKTCKKILMPVICADASEQSYVQEESTATEIFRHFQSAHAQHGVVGPGFHPLEGVMQPAVHAPYGKLSIHIRWKHHFIRILQGGECNLGHLIVTPSGCCYPQFQSYYYRNEVHKGFPTVGTQGTVSYFPVLTNGQSVCRYNNLNAHPHWSCIYWFPPDGDLAWGSTFDQDYWIDLRSQWMFHPSLTTGENRKSRNALVSAPLKNSPLFNYMEYAYGSPTSWWGNCRFPTASVAIPDYKELTTVTEPDWFFASCTAAFAAGGITLTPTGGATLITANYALGNFLRHPYMFPHVCEAIWADWDLTNVVGVEVILENVNGEELLITTQRGVQVHIPNDAEDAKFAGSWAQQFAGYSGGADIGPDGISLATMADEERNMAYQLHAGWQGMNLRFKITVANTNNPVVLKYPRFYSAQTRYRIVDQTGQVSALVFGNGPGVRFGQWGWANESVDTPVLRLPGDDRHTIYDGWAWRNLVLLGQARHVPGDLNVYFDTVEGPTTASFLSGGSSFLLNSVGPGLATPTMKLAMINGLRSVPPLAMFPKKQLNSVWVETGSYAQEAWSLAVGPTNYVSAKEPFHLEKDVGGVRDRWTGTNVDNGIPGWPITRHEHEVTNTEASSEFWGIIGTDERCNAVPWFGHFIVGGRGSNPGEGLSITRDTLNMHYIAGVIPVDGLFVRVTNFRTRDSLEMVTSDLTADNPAICYVGKGTTIVLYDNGTAIKQSISHSGGEEGFWSVPATMIATGTHPSITVDPDTGQIYVAYHDGTGIQCRAYQRVDKLVANDAYHLSTITASAPAGAIALQAGLSGERWLVALFTDNSGNVQQRFNYGGGEGVWS